MVGSIDNTSGSDGGYGDHTSVSTGLAIGTSHSISLHPGFSGSAYNEYWKVWIDFNRDGDFGDAGELVFDAGGLYSSAVQGNLVVPSGVQAGLTTMRVSMKYNGASTSCESFSYGEVEDYTVNIGSGSSKVTANGNEEELELSTTENPFDCTVYPNPATENAMVSITLPQATGSLQISLFDLQGRLVSTEQWNNTDRVNYNLRTGQLDAGVYHIVIQSNDYNHREKLVVVR